MNKREQIEYIKKELKVDEEYIRQNSIHGCMAQIAYLRGMENVLRCDADSGQGDQYSGDLWKDLHGKSNERK